ncbi:MAG TPA: efflux RND transporter periplasmic adaptor subunit [Candidatus Limnocylindrales bacterium]|nr:efflux RND transporter periplasmic adaptor subunit [Candidatus Limnocylindrales bacterium]
MTARATLPTAAAARRALAAAAALLALAATGCQSGPKAGGFKPPPMPVEIAPVVQGTVADRFESVGSVEAGEAIQVVSEIDGVVKSMPFQEGQPVGAGALLVQLDDAQLKAEVERSEAQRDQARSSHDRVQAVVSQGAGAPQDLDDAAAALKVAEANLSLADTRLRKTRITAPFAGVTGAKSVSPGAYLRAGTPITDLASIGEIKVTFSVPERYLGRLRRGAAVNLAAPAFPGYTLVGAIDVLDPVLDPQTRSSKVIARVRNPGGRFRPGMSVDVTAVLSQRPEAVTVPNEAVFSEGGQNFVYVVKQDSTVTRSALTLGTRLADVVEVVKGLSPGQFVVRAGHQKLFEGAKVIPIQSGAKKEPS